jgi:hypothetical protein
MEGEVPGQAEKSVDNCALSELRRPQPFSDSSIPAALEGQPGGSRMEWIIESYDRRTDRDGENRYTTENAFISAAEELLRNMWRGFVSAKLPDGSVLDEAQLRALVVRATPNN